MLHKAITTAVMGSLPHEYSGRLRDVVECKHTNDFSWALMGGAGDCRAHAYAIETRSS